MLVVLAVFLAPQAGWHFNTVMSGSMEPAISAGDVVIASPVDPAEIRVGDVILFENARGYVCHRVIEVKQAPSMYFLTKGDANSDPDSATVAPASVRGKVVTSIPGVGYLSRCVKTPLGLILTLVLPGLLIIGIEFRKLWRGRGE